MSFQQDIADLLRTEQLDRVADAVEDMDKELAKVIFAQTHHQYPRPIRITTALLFGRLAVLHWVMVRDKRADIAAAVWEWCAVVLANHRFDIEDTTDRLVMCDWLEDNNRPLLVQFLRENINAI